ncbi:MAG: type II toxin-antitoxin system RelE/ParE family toxin [Oscillospiraceae bacterium]|nr:type II toxin-antitoxin system RelE/ParE family toxin [Oscillospiraceae bacterium]
MSAWRVEYTESAKQDIDSLSRPVRLQINKAVYKVSQNPLPRNEGGYGNPLRNKGGQNLTGLFKIKLLKPGIRVIYKLVREDGVMKVIVVAARADA